MPKKLRGPSFFLWRHQSSYLAMWVACTVEERVLCCWWCEALVRSVAAVCTSDFWSDPSKFGINCYHLVYQWKRLSATELISELPKRKCLINTNVRRRKIGEFVAYPFQNALKLNEDNEQAPRSCAVRYKENQCYLNAEERYPFRSVA